MPERPRKRPTRTVGVSAFLAVFFAFVLWTELNPKGIACGGVSTICSSAVKNISTAIDMYQQDHDEMLPITLEALVPDYLRSMPHCFGTFNGCRPITTFGITAAIRSWLEPKPDHPTVPDYRVFDRPGDSSFYELQCLRAHRGKYSYTSRTEKLTVSWD